MYKPFTNFVFVEKVCTIVRNKTPDHVKAQTQTLHNHLHNFRPHRIIRRTIKPSQCNPLFHQASLDGHLDFVFFHRYKRNQFQR